MSSCIGCVCNVCVYNADLDPQYFTPGEIDNVCFNCDDCMTTNGHSQWDEKRCCWTGCANCYNCGAPAAICWQEKMPVM